MNTWSLVVIGVGLLTQACQDSYPPPLGSTHPPLAAGPASVAGVVGVVAQGASPRERAAAVDPGPVPVDDEALAKEVKQTSPRELWPRPLKAADAVWSRGPGWYTASLPLERHHVIVHGTRLRFGEAEKEPDRVPKLTRMDGIVEVDLVRDGVAYTVAIECERPAEDARCAADDYVMGLVGQLEGGLP